MRGPVSRSGFGFFHDGRVDSLTRFLQDGFGLTDDQETADVIAFLLAFTGSDLPPTLPVLSPPVVPSKDVSAGVGVQETLTNNVTSSLLAFMISHALAATSRVDLVVHGIRDGAPRGWLMNGQNFISDKRGETNSFSGVLAFASEANPLRFTFVPKGSGQRIALDRDEDGIFNQTEIEGGTDPVDSLNRPPPRLDLVEMSPGIWMIQPHWDGRIWSNIRVQGRNDFSPGTDWADINNWPGLPGVGSARFYRFIFEP